MEVGKSVKVKKGEEKDEEGVIIRMEGARHSRRWVVQFENGVEKSFHAKSLELVENEYSTDGENNENNEENRRDEGEIYPNNEAEVEIHDQDIEGGEEEFDEEWVGRVEALG